jgi:hypothetical protein
LKKNYLEYIGIAGRIIIKLIFNKQNEKHFAGLIIRLPTRTSRMFF